MTEQPAPRAWPRRAALTLVAAVTAASYAWAINRDPLEGYYAAAVRSMSMSWHDFIFGAFDPAGTITLDKLPGAFWVQALAVRAFGLHTWVIVAPQAVEGVLTVLVLYRAVRRLAGPTAGLIAAIVFAVSPATVALNRGNISDTLMILLLVLAADAASAAITSSRPGGSQGQLILAGVWVGLAFQAKMIEAWLLLPALGLAFLIAAPGRAVRRLRQLAVAAVVTGVVSLAWITAFSLVPAAHRPYADGSHDNSVYQQVFVYNGFGRLGDQTPLQLLAGQGISLQRVAPGQAPAPDRLLRGGLGRDSGWLLPAALAVAGWGLLARRRAPRGDPLRACLVLWGGWLLTLAVTFSVTTTLNAYYTAALTPAVAAILGAGLAAAWSARRPAASLLAGLAGVAAGTAGYAAWLLSTGTGVPGWVVPAVLAAGLAAVAAAATALVRGRPGPGSAGASGAARRDRVLAAALGTGLVAALLGPAVARSTRPTSRPRRPRPSSCCSFSSRSRSARFSRSWRRHSSARRTCWPRRARRWPRYSSTTAARRRCPWAASPGRSPRPRWPASRQMSAWASSTSSSCRPGRTAARSCAGSSRTAGPCPASTRRCAPSSASRPTPADAPAGATAGRSQAARGGDRVGRGLAGAGRRDPGPLEVRHVDVGGLAGRRRRVQRREVLRPLLVEGEDGLQLRLQVGGRVAGDEPGGQRGPADQAAAAVAFRLRVALGLLVHVPGDARRRDAGVPVAGQEGHDGGIVVRQQAGRRGGAGHRPAPDRRRRAGRGAGRRPGRGAGQGVGGIGGCRRAGPDKGMAGRHGRLDVLLGVRLRAAGGGSADLVRRHQPGCGLRGRGVRARHQVADLGDRGERADHGHRRGGPARPAGHLLDPGGGRMPT
jgi:4-amino-4-deoxy-L-arabinose transferase-like glycosyltransferase